MVTLVAHVCTGPDPRINKNNKNKKRARVEEKKKRSCESLVHQSCPVGNNWRRPFPCLDSPACMNSAVQFPTLGFILLPCHRSERFLRCRHRQNTTHAHTQEKKNGLATWQTERRSGRILWSPSNIRIGITICTSFAAAPTTSDRQQRRSTPKKTPNCVCMFEINTGVNLLSMDLRMWVGKKKLGLAEPEKPQIYPLKKNKPNPKQRRACMYACLASRPLLLLAGQALIRAQKKHACVVTLVTLVRASLFFPTRPTPRFLRGSPSSFCLVFFS